MINGDMKAARNGRMPCEDSREDPNKIKAKPSWLIGIKCSCGSERLKQDRGEFDANICPRKITCRKCGLSSNFRLSIDGVLDDWARLTNQVIPTTYKSHYEGKRLT